jgi:sugar lactone lactonase YvrE
MMRRLVKRWFAAGSAGIGIAVLAAAFFFGTAFSASAMVWSDGRPLIQARDLAGTGVYDEFDGPAERAEFRHPAGVLVLADGGVLVSDSDNHRIRIVRDGGVSVFAGVPVSLLADDAGLPAGALVDGPSDTSLFRHPAGLAADRSGNIYVADAGNHAIRKISPSGDVTTLAGSGVLGHRDGTGSGALFHYPTDVAVDAAGNVYVADTLNHAIRKISPRGEVTTLNALSDRTVEVYDGVVVPAGGFADGQLTQALFNEPSGLAIDAKGNLYVSDTGNQRIRYIDFAAGTVTTVAGGGDPAENALYVQGDYLDGPAPLARFNSPKGIAADGDGGLFIADSLNHAIRYLKDGRVHTVAGHSAAKYGHRNGFDTDVLLNVPVDVAVDAAGNLVVADKFNNRIRTVEFVSLPDDRPADGTVRVLLNGEPLDFEQPPAIRSGRTMVAVEAAADALGYAFGRHDGDIILTGDGVTLALAVGRSGLTRTAEAEGLPLEASLDAAPFIRDGTIYVPLRPLAETAGFKVDWHKETVTVILRK